VTETAVADPDQALAVLRPLHQQGVRISIDDFGTGFTSLALLPTLPLDELKVDQSFVLRSASSPADEAIVRTVGELAHRLGLQVVAEGVETAETAVLLRAMGIDLLQGYHFARPMPEADLVRFVTQADPVPSRVPTTMVTPTAGRPRTVV
jgi:EAL domain-containing protein (putative c-di-GMP-specific phosphodiesterase class I)